MKSKLTFASSLILLTLTTFAQIKRPDGGPAPKTGMDYYAILIGIVIGLIIGLIIGYFFGSKNKNK